MAHPDVLVHVAGGSEEPVTDVALVGPGHLRVPAAAPQPLLQDPVHGLHVHVQVAGLGVAAATHFALVGPFLAVAPHVSLQERGHAELAGAGGAGEGQQGGGRRHSLVLLPAPEGGLGEGAPGEGGQGEGGGQHQAGRGALGTSTVSKWGAPGGHGTPLTILFWDLSLNQ